MLLERREGRHQRFSEESWDSKHSLTPPCLDRNLQGRCSSLVVFQPVRKWLGKSCATYLKVKAKILGGLGWSQSQDCLVELSYSSSNSGLQGVKQELDSCLFHPSNKPQPLEGAGDIQDAVEISLGKSRKPVRNLTSFAFSD